MPASCTHLVLIPTFNTGVGLLLRSVREARVAWSAVWVVVDGSTDGSAAALAAMACQDSDSRVLKLPRNAGKGAAVLAGLRQADDAGFTHVLVMDADGQHPADCISLWRGPSPRTRP
jgi:glycosyltransferase involved in cell wall biosynthesis